MNSREKLEKTFKLFRDNNGIIISTQIVEGNRVFFLKQQKSEKLEKIQKQNILSFNELFKNSSKTELLGVFDRLEEPSYFIYENENESIENILKKIKNNPFFQYSYISILNGKYSFSEYKKHENKYEINSSEEKFITIENFLIEEPNGDYSQVLETGVYMKL